MKIDPLSLPDQSQESFVSWRSHAGQWDRWKEGDDL